MKSLFPIQCYVAVMGKQNEGAGYGVDVLIEPRP